MRLSTADTAVIDRSRTFCPSIGNSSIDATHYERGSTETPKSSGAQGKTSVGRNEHTLLHQNCRQIAHLFVTEVVNLGLGVRDGGHATQQPQALARAVADRHGGGEHSASASGQRASSQTGFLAQFLGDEGRETDRRLASSLSTRKEACAGVAILTFPHIHFPQGV